MVLAVADLVDADPVQLAALQRHATPLDGARDDVANGWPGDLHHLAHDGPVGLLGEVDDEVLKVAGEGGAKLGPGELLGDEGAAVPAPEPTGRGAQVDLPGAEVEVAPQPARLRVVDARQRAAVAARARPATAGGDDIDEDDEGIDMVLDAGDANALQAQQVLEYLADVHGGTLRGLMS